MSAVIEAASSAEILRVLLYQPALRLTHKGDSQTDKTLNQWRRAYGGHNHGFSDRFAG
jgi:hypothetical protein